jgi:hypothetical protein
MNAVDYILDAVLLATVFFQFRGRRLTPRNLGLPVAIVIYFLFAPGSMPATRASTPKPVF